MIQINSTELNRFKSLTSQNPVDTIFTNVTTPENAKSGSLTFISTVPMATTALNNKASGLIVLEKFYADIKPLLGTQHAVWTTKDIKAAMSEVLTAFDQKPQGNQKIHPTAVIHATAKIGNSVTVSEYVVIQENAIIGDHCWIGAHSVVETSAHIKDHTLISAHVVIGSFCEIGSHCRFASHTTIGSDGFGYYTDKTNTHYKIPQIGKVVIEDHCEFGSHCSVDRSTLTETRIKAGSKLDNFCHIAHNVELGENAMLAAGFMTAGSSRIGKNFTTGGGVHTNGHIQITDNVILAGNTGVVSSIEAAGVYGGFPHVPHKDNLKIMSSLIFLPKLRRQVSAILKHLGLDSE